MTSEEARQAARARWGSTRIDGLIDELAQRRAELGTQQLAALVALVDDEGETP